MPLAYPQADSTRGQAIVSHREWPEPQRNRLLALMERPDYDALAPMLEAVTLARGRVVYESGAHQDHLYFPLDSIIAVLYSTLDGRTMEVSLTGREGAVGLGTFMGTGRTPQRAVVQCTGPAYRVISRAVKSRFETSAPLRLLLLSYSEERMIQISQGALCSRYHTLEQQLCRWLLMSADRVDQPVFSVTHEFLAGLLGARRESVNQASRNLQRLGLIGSRRGTFWLLDRKGLEARVCECYAVLRRSEEELTVRIRIPRNAH
jgi:CRP-like cAMP-binding protein